jgi:hypothetical protein
LINNICAEENLVDSQSGPSVGDIKIEHHPDTKQVPDFIPLKTYQARQKLKKPRSNTRKPWKPFKSRSEFEFAEVALKAGLTKNQVNTLIHVIDRRARGEDSFDIRDHDHMHTIWDAGAILHATVCLFCSSFFLNNSLLISLINDSPKSIQYRSHTKRMMFEILIFGHGHSGIGE